MAGASISTISQRISDILRDALLRELRDVCAKPGRWDGHYAAQIEEEMADGLYDPLLQQIATMVLEEYEERMLVSPNITPYLLDKSYMVQYPVP